MRLSVLIVDDEPLAREGLRMLLSEDSEVSSIREARNGIEAVAAIREAPPDLVFLDIQMPEMDGFAVVREIGAESMPSVVFVTAHDRFAVHAFDINAIDYLLKPVTRERFAQGLERAKTRMNARVPEKSRREILSLLESIASPQRYVKRLAVRSAGKTLFVNVEQIDWIEAAENYVKLHATRADYFMHVAMNTLEKSIDPELFLRIHRSFMVNIRRIREMEPARHGEYIVTLHNGVRLQSGRHYHARLKALVTNPF